MKFSTGQNDDDDDDDEDCVSNDDEKVAPAARATQEMKTASLRIILQLWIQDRRSTGKNGSMKCNTETRHQPQCRVAAYRRSTHPKLQPLGPRRPGPQLATAVHQKNRSSQKKTAFSAFFIRLFDKFLCFFALCCLRTAAACRHDAISSATQMRETLTRKN